MMLFHEQGIQARWLLVVVGFHALAAIAAWRFQPDPERSGMPPVLKVTLHSPTQQAPEPAVRTPVEPVPEVSPAPVPVRQSPPVLAAPDVAPELPAPRIEPPPLAPPRPVVEPEPMRAEPAPAVPTKPVMVSQETASPPPVQSARPAPLPAVTPAPEAVAVVPPRFDVDYLENPAPAYPNLSRRLREQGKVVLRVKVSPEGLPQQIEVRDSSGFPRLDQAARDSVQRWKFVPAKQGGQAVTAWVLVPISYSLRS